MIYRIFDEQSIRHLRITRGSIMASDVRREANEDRLNIREDKSAIEIRATTQGKVYVVTPLIEYLTVLLEYIDLLSP